MIFKLLGIYFCTQLYKAVIAIISPWKTKTSGHGKGTKLKSKFLCCWIFLHRFFLSPSHLHSKMDQISKIFCSRPNLAYGLIRDRVIAPPSGGILVILIKLFLESWLIKQFSVPFFAQRQLQPHSLSWCFSLSSCSSRVLECWR